MGDKKDYDRIDDGSEAAEDAQLAWRAATVRELEANFETLAEAIRRLRALSGS